MVGRLTAPSHEGHPDLSYPRRHADNPGVADRHHEYQLVRRASSTSNSRAGLRQRPFRSRCDRLDVVREAHNKTSSWLRAMLSTAVRNDAGEGCRHLWEPGWCGLGSS
jgi:hypothetical protein